MPLQVKGQVRPEKSAYHSIALLTKSFKKDISLLCPRACSTMDKIVDRCALTIYPYSLGVNTQRLFHYLCNHVLIDAVSLQ
jgi:hypothetical protein